MSLIGFDSQLAAGGEDIVAASGAFGGEDRGFLKLSKEGVDLFGGRAFEGSARVFVVGDEVDLGTEGAGELDQAFGILLAVIDAFDEGIFKGDREALLGREGLEFAEGVEESLEVVTFVDGHDGIALFIGGGVEGDSEANGVGPTEIKDLRAEASGGDGDAAVSEFRAEFVGEDRDGAEEVFEIDQGFAHAHEDDIGDVLALRSEERGTEELAHEFGDTEVSTGAHRGGVAEAAADGTTDLARDTQGEPPSDGDKDSLDLCAVLEAEEDLASAIDGVHDAIDF